MRIIKLLLLLLYCLSGNGQSFYLGADLSYVNEMEDCGVVYFEGQEAKDPYAIFSDYGCNLVRLRLWHTPDWYDGLNSGKRYSYLGDVKKSIGRAKQQAMNTLLDFHLSDNWADPSKQLVPAAWLPVVNNLPVLQDSLYNYIFNTLDGLHQTGLLPEMVQIGNETNKGILLSPEDNQGYKLDWPRNAALFNSGIKAVRDFEAESGQRVQIVLHVADPKNAEWMVGAFHENGVRDFDIIGLSYYWAWHQPVSISDAGGVIQKLKKDYPDKEVLIVETGYIWTNEAKDAANNIISVAHPDYQPVSPATQRDWLIDLTKATIQSGGLGVIYWEPAWVSSDCYTQWGQGSHQEHATFFDFDNRLLIPGGMEWMSYNYGLVSPVKSPPSPSPVQIFAQDNGTIRLRQLNPTEEVFQVEVTDSLGQMLLSTDFNGPERTIALPDLATGFYLVTVRTANGRIWTKKLVFSKED